MTTRQKEKAKEKEKRRWGMASPKARENHPWMITSTITCRRESLKARRALSQKVKARKAKADMMITTITRPCAKVVRARAKGKVSQLTTMTTTHHQKGKVSQLTTM